MGKYYIPMGLLWDIYGQRLSSSGTLALAVAYNATNNQYLIGVANEMRK
jgi:hypothetical protein